MPGSQSEERICALRRNLGSRHDGLGESKTGPIVLSWGTFRCRRLAALVSAIGTRRDSVPS